MKIIICTVMCILILKEVECGYKNYVTPLILSSKVSDEDFTSSCVVVEDGVPMCQDPGEINANDMRSPAVRTPYPADGFDAVENSGWKTRGGGGVGSPRARGPWSWSWWFGGPKRKRPQKEPRATAVSASSSAHAIVTYLLKGCSPAKAPFGLFPCSARDDDGGQQDPAMRISSSTRIVYYVPPSTQQQPSSRPKATLLRPTPRETSRTSA